MAIEVHKQTDFEKRFKQGVSVLYEGFLNSYAQIFFTTQKFFAVIVLIVTFFDYNAGLCGALGVMISNLIAYIMGFNKHNIALGYYSFNTLLVALGLGIFYQPNIELFVIIFFVAFFTLLISVALQGIIGKYGVPYLSVPFLIVLWLITLATREFSALEISQRGIYIYNELYAFGGMPAVEMYKFFDNILFHDAVIIYLKSLGAIFFQYNIFAGFLLSIGLIIYSRQAFLLSVIGFGAAYLYYHFIGANFNELSYGYIGFNFILTAIALGGFFIIPSFYSYIFVLFLTPIISVLITSTTALFSVYQLPIYSLPFNIVVIVFLYVLKFREKRYHVPEVVLLPKNSPEDNLYLHTNHKSRFNYNIPIGLPIQGEWRIAQGHSGDITHKDNWRYAWDFDIVDDNNVAYAEKGTHLNDFFAYNKPVVAPGDGIVEFIEDGIADNEIGEINLKKNWGNTIIIKHTPFLYSKISHLKPYSIKIFKGQYVKKGELIALSGNSGRSPEPHVHFQLQATPYIGSETLLYPIAHYVKTQNKTFQIGLNDIPKLNEVVSNLKKDTLLFNALNFINGQKLNFSINLNDKPSYNVEWEVKTDIFNHSFIFCAQTNSKAYFYNDGHIHYFTHYEGDKKALLFYFFAGLYKITLGFYKNMKVSDSFPINRFTNNILLQWLQDFVAPFYLFIKCTFVSTYISKEEYMNLEKAVLESTTNVSVFNKTIKKIICNFEFKDDKIISFTINDDKIKIEATCKK